MKVTKEYFNKLASKEGDRVDTFKLYLDYIYFEDDKHMKRYYDTVELCYLTVIGSY